MRRVQYPELGRSGEDAWRIARIDACTTNSQATGKLQPLIESACWMRGNTDRSRPGVLVLYTMLWLYCVPLLDMCLIATLFSILLGILLGILRCGHDQVTTRPRLRPFTHSSRCIYLDSPASSAVASTASSTRNQITAIKHSNFQPPAPVSREALSMPPKQSGDLARHH